MPPDVLAEHARAVLDTVSVANIAAQGFRVFLDANSGAGGPLGSQLLHDLGCAVVQYECEPTGIFAHEPEPIPAHLTEVAPWVRVVRIGGRVRPRSRCRSARAHRRDGHVRAARK